MGFIMLSSRLFGLILAAALGSVVATPALAQSNACVHLLVGAGFAAKMRVTSGDFATEWSDSFPIGQTKCQSLKDVSDGKNFTVEVHALAGHTKKCSPENIKRVASSPSSVTFQTWGTTLNVKCQEPGTTENAEMTEASRTPNAQGAEAAKNPPKE
jgi:hypothetical protein